jgi:hypothetical protein
MRVLLLLGVVGAAIYALLVVTDNVVPDGQLAGQTQPSHQGHRELRSWGTTLPGLVVAQRPSPRHPPQDAAYTSGSYREHSLQSSDQTAGGPHPASADKAAALDTGSKQEALEWAKVMLAARAHSEASVSSATVRFYPPGTELQVVSRQNGWVQLSDPVTQESGWVFEKHLASIDGPDPTPAAESTEPLPAPAVLAKSRKQNRSGAVRVSNEDVVKPELRKGRWARRGDRRRGFRLFGRFAAR